MELAELPVWLMAPANRLRGWKAGHANGAVFTRKPGIAVHWSAGGRDIVADRSFARDLNLDQIVAAIAGDREERELITRVLFGPLHDADAVCYRQEVFQDLENPALFGEVQRFSGLIRGDRVEVSRYQGETDSWGSHSVVTRAWAPARSCGRG